MRKTSTFLLKRKNSFIFLIASILLLSNCRKDNLSVVNPSAFNKEKITARFFEMPFSISDDIKNLATNIKTQDSLYNFLPEFVTKNGYPNWSKVVFTMENSQDNQLKSLSNQTSENASDKGFFLIPLTDEVTSKVKSYIFAKKHGKDSYSYSLYNRQSLSEVKVADSLESDLIVTQAIFGYFEKSINGSEEIEITNPEHIKLKNVNISFGETKLKTQSSSNLKPNYWVCNLVETVKISFQTVYLTTGDSYTETIFTPSISSVCQESNEEGGGANTGWWNYLTGYIGDNPGNTDPFYPWWLPGGIGDGIPNPQPITSQEYIINKLAIINVAKIQFLHGRGDISDAFVLYLKQNGDVTENIDFLKWAFDYLFINQNLNFEEFLNPVYSPIDYELIIPSIVEINSTTALPNPNINGLSNYYSDLEAEALINNLNNNLTGDPIELYMNACYKGSKLLNLSAYSVSSQLYRVGDYDLAPHYDANNNLVFYAAYRNQTNGIEYIIRADALSLFVQKYKIYKSAADLFYLNGKPSLGMLQYVNGDYLDGLMNMWGDALKSPEYYVYLGNIFVGVSTNLQTVRWTNITKRNTRDPNYRIDSHSWQDYKNAISNKHGAWQPTSNPSVQIIESNGYKWSARPNATDWPNGFTIEYFKNGELKGKFRFTR